MQTRILQISLIAGGIFLGVVILELGARLLPPSAPQFRNFDDTYECSLVLGWQGQANYQGIIERPEYSHPLQFNAAGMHDTNHPPQKAENTFRILWVGDSFAEAVQVDESQTAHQQLENLLNERLGGPQRKFEVVVGSVTGWGTGQELLYYQQQGHRYQADLVVILFFIGNDVQDNLPGHALTLKGRNCFAPYFAICADGQLDPQPWRYVPGLEPAWGQCLAARKTVARGLSWVQQHSALFARLEPLLLKLKSIRVIGAKFDQPYTALYLPDESDEVSYGWQISQALLAEFDRHVRADDAKFGVALIGPREVLWISLFNQGQLSELFETDPHLAKAHPNLPNQRLLDFLRSRNIPALDLQQPMVERMAAEGVELYYPFDRHWTAAGNRMAAELIFEWLVAQNLLE